MRESDRHLGFGPLHARGGNRFAYLQCQIVTDQVSWLGRRRINQNVGENIAWSRQDIDHCSQWLSAPLIRSINTRRGACLVPTLRSEDALHQGAVLGQPRRDLRDICCLAVAVLERRQIIELPAQVRVRLFIGRIESVHLNRVGDLEDLLVALFLSELDRLHFELFKRRKRSHEFGITDRRIADFFHRVAVGQRRVVEWRRLARGRIAIGLLCGDPAFELLDRLERCVESKIGRGVQFRYRDLEFLIGDNGVKFGQVRVGRRNWDGKF